MDALFLLLRSAVSGEALSESDRDVLTSESIASAVELAHKHDIVHLLALGLKKNGLLGESGSSLEKEIFKAVYRYERSERELEKLCGVLEAEKIAYIPLKGAVIRRYYPEPWMRTSCDIDVLVSEEQLEGAACALVSGLGYRREKKNYHDISLISPSGVHLELHFNICENMENIDLVLARYAEYTVNDGGYRDRFTDEFFIFHQFAHAVYHFMHGGCGIRAVLDLKILESELGINASSCTELLDKCGILTFATELEKLADVWFGHGEYTDVTRRMGEYILIGGAYGSGSNMLAVQQQKRGGHFKYTLSRIFLPYNALKQQYPCLEKHKLLLPFMQLRRWGRLLFGGRMRASLSELSLSNSISDAEADSVAELLRSLKL